MKTRIQKTSIVWFIALACWWCAGSSNAQVPGLYKDGVLVEQMDALIPQVSEPQSLNTTQLAHPVREISGDTMERNLASGECAAAVEKVREQVMRLHVEGREPDAGERHQLAALKAEVELAAAKLAQALAPDEAGLMKESGLPPVALERRLASMELMQRNKEEYLAAIDALTQGKPGALAPAAELVEKFRPTPEKPLPDQPTISSDNIEAPRMTREEANAWRASKASGGIPSSPPKAPAVEDSATPPESPNDNSEEIPTPAPQGGPEGAPPIPADLAPTVEIQFTPEITAKAAELGNSALAIYEFVRNKVEFQPYLGSRKGAAETLRQLHGNDTDQASLLMALLRVSGIPCRYVRGSVEMTAAQATSWLGVDAPATAGGILTTAGLDGISITNGIDVVAVQCTRVWVEAYIPYTNYRGIPNAVTGKTWVPLDPAFHGSIVTPGEDVLAAMDFDSDDYLADYISTFHPESPVEKLLTDIQAWLDANDPGTTVADIERTTEMDSQKLGLLPASIPGQLLAVSSRFSELENNKRYKVRFQLRNGGTTLIDHTVNVSDLAGHQLTIDYIGATPADQTIIDANGGIYETPPNLVNVKPRLKLDGNVLVTSTFAIGMGRTHDSDMQFIQPVGDNNVQPWVRNSIIAGNSQAIAFNTFFDQGDGFLFGGTAPALSFLEMQLHGTAADYLGRVDDGIQQTGRIMRVATTQEVSEAIVESAVSVTTSFGVPVTFEWTGLTVDADRRIIGTFPVDGDDSKEVPFMLLSGYEGSIQENRVFEDIYDQEAVSTIKILELSSDSNIPVFRITSSIASQAPGLSQSSSIVTAINNALAQGHHVIIPRTPITVGLWQGTGYIDLDPLTGAAGYIISGGISGSVSANGGATVEEWPVFLPCNNPTISNDPGDPIRSYSTEEPSTAVTEFSGGDNHRIILKGKFNVACPNKPTQSQSFNKTTSFRISEIAANYGPGNYTLTLLTTVFLQFTIFEIKIDTIDANFAPSAEQLEVKYTVYPAGFSVPYAKIEAFKSGDTTNPIFKNESIAKSGTTMAYNWDGKANQGADSGKFISPENSPFLVRVSTDKKADFANAAKDEKSTKVEIESITLYPSGADSFVKPSRTASEIDKEIEATISIKTKSGAGAITQIPLTLDWSFEDPDDTATSPGIDSNGASGDDNAPIANGGKRGTGSTLWAASTGFPATLDPNGQIATSDTKTSGADMGKTKIKLLTSAVTGDNYILVAQFKDASGTAVKEKKSGILSVRKALDFQNAYQMTSGVGVATIMATANIDPAFSADGYTDYSLGAVQSIPSGAGSPEYFAPLLVPNASETPTAQQLADYAGADPVKKAVAETAITATAQAWFQRNQDNLGPSVTAVATAIGVTAPAVVGARYYHPKLDGRGTTGQTTYYPAGIMIAGGAGQVDPDDDWREVQGIELGEIAYILLNSGNSARQQIVGRHEAGHASDHVPFGVSSDHATSGLMTPTGSASTFSDDSILRLRGWSR